MAALSRANALTRERFKKAVAELAQAQALDDDIQRKRAEGPPKCFTIGCQSNFEYDLWRYDPADDYTGQVSPQLDLCPFSLRWCAAANPVSRASPRSQGMEKPKGILKPKGFEYEGGWR